MRSVGLTTIFLALLVSVAGATVDPNLVAWYKMASTPGYGALDDSSGNNYGGGIVDMGASSGYTGGYFHQAADSTRIFCNSMPFNSNGAFTWSIKIRTTDTDAGLIERGSDPWWNWPFGSKRLVIKGGVAEFDWCGQPEATGVRGTTNVSDGQWHYVAAVYDAGQHMSIYIDGVVDAAGYAPLPNSTDNTTIFQFCEAAGGHFVGDVNDIRIYKKALTAREVALIHERYDLYDPNLVAQYKLTQPTTDGYIIDYSGNNYGGGIDFATNDPPSAFTGTSFHFGGKCRMFAEVPSFSSRSAFTWAVWFKTTTSAGTLIQGGEKRQGQAAETDFIAGDKGLSLTSDGIRFDSYNQNAAFADKVVTDDQWHHVATTFDGQGTVLMYVDGVLATSEAIPLQDSNAVTSTQFFFGFAAASHFVGDMKDIRIYDRMLSDAEISRLGGVGDFNGDNKVDGKDLGLFTSEWLKSYTGTPLTFTPVENGDFESYGVSSVFADHWQEYMDGAVYLGSGSNSQVSLITDAASAHSGSKALTWDYNSIDSTGQNLTYTEIYYTLDTPIANISDYDQMRVWIKRHAGNSHEGLLYVKFLDGGLSTGYIGAEAWLQELEGSSFANPDEWYEWVIDLNGLKWDNNYTELTNIQGIMFGVSDDGGTGGTGTIDIDDISFVNLPTCSTNKDEDFNGDCVINFADFATFAQNWMFAN